MLTSAMISEVLNYSNFCQDKSLLSDREIYDDFLSEYKGKLYTKFIQAKDEDESVICQIIREQSKLMNKQTVEERTLIENIQVGVEMMVEANVGYVDDFRDEMCGEDIDLMESFRDCSIWGDKGESEEPYQLWTVYKGKKYQVKVLEVKQQSGEKEQVGNETTYSFSCQVHDVLFRVS